MFALPQDRQGLRKPLRGLLFGAGGRIAASGGRADLPFITPKIGPLRIELFPLRPKESKGLPQPFSISAADASICTALSGLRPHALYAARFSVSFEDFLCQALQAQA